MNYSIIFTLLFSILFISCGGAENKSSDPLTLEKQIDAYINSDQYDEALELLEEQESNDEVQLLKEKVHLNYGIHLIYSSDPAQMRENANKALMQFAQVLKINPDNEKAVSEIEQILSIYRTFPDRQPAPEVLEELKALGFTL